PWALKALSPDPFYLKGSRGRKFGGSPAWEDSALSPTLAVRRRSGLRGSTRLCHHHRGGTDQPIIELVSPGHLRHDRAGGLVALRRRAQQTLVRILQALRRLSRALERLFQLRLQHGQLLRVGGCAAGVAAALRHRPLLVHRGARRDLGIVWNQVISSKRGGNIAQRSASPRGSVALILLRFR